ncbi:MAG: hypothetical protein NUV82_03320 [Candidatus Komeilibacteria bacterium]|nr:hypothetical protein [Candidatus Komeilibacteria bacterium]
MKEIVKIDAIAVAKILGLLLGGIYLAIGIILNLVVLIFGLGNLSGLDFLGFGSGLVATLLVSIIIGLVGFIVGLLLGWLYNVAANYFGGIVIMLEDRSVVEDRIRESKAAKIALRQERERMRSERKRLQEEDKHRRYSGDDDKKSFDDIPTP